MVILITFAAGLLVMASPTIASAVTTGPAGNNSCGVDTEIIKCDPNVVDVTKGGVTGNGIWALLIIAINLLSGLVGIAAVGGIVYGSILYTTAAGNAEQVKKALEFIRNVVIGLVAYALMFALLNFIIPGGLFSS